MHRGVLIGVNVLLAALLAVALAALARQALGMALRGQHQVALPNPTSKPPPKLPPLESFGAITQGGLFGLPPTELKALHTPAPAPKTPLGRAVLKGVAAGALSYVLLKSNGQEEVYALGQEVPGIGILREVKPTEAVFETPEGGPLSLPLKDVAAFSPAPEAKRGPVRQTSSSSFIIDRTAMEALLENPAQVLTHARLLPHMHDGRQEGFVVRELKPDGGFATLGLREGDVLLRLNGYPITGPEAALKAFTSLKGLSRVELDVLREGQRLTLSYHIQ